MAKLVDAEDLKPFVERREGSIPSLATKKETMANNKSIQSISDVPTTEHWQLIRFDFKVNNNGYEDNATYKIYIFASIEELENEVLRLQLDKYVPPFFVQKVFGRAEIVITTKVKIQ